MSEQTEAQRLADELVVLHGYPLSIRAAAELRRLDEKCEALIGDAVRETRQIHRIAVLEAANEQLLKALEPDRQLLQQALDALENSVDRVLEDAYQAEKFYGNYPTRQGKVNGLKVLADDHEKAITALTERLAQPEQEPVAIALNTGTKQGVKWLKNVEHGENLYTTPPAAQPAPDMQRHNDYMAGFNEGYDRAEKNARNTTPLAAAQPEQHPVAFVNADHLQGLTLGYYGCAEIYTDESEGRVPLYTTAPAAPMTEFEEAVAACDNTLHYAIDYWQDRALKAEAKLAQPEQEPVAEVVWGAKTDFEWKFKMLAELACVEDVPVKLYAGPFKGAASYWHDTKTDKGTTPPAAQKTNQCGETCERAKLCATCGGMLAQPKQEPVAWMFQHGETGRMSFVSNDKMNNPELFLKMNPRYALVCALVTPPAAQPAMFGPMGTVGDLFDKHVIANGNLKKEWIVYLEKNT